MEITIQGTEVIIKGDRIIGFALDNLVNRFEATTDLPDGWEYQLYVHMKLKNKFNIINLKRDGQKLYVDLTSDMLPFGGRYEMQFIATKDELIGRTDIFEVWVENSIDPSCQYDPIPSEFYQFEEEIKKIYEDCKDIYDKIQSGAFLDIGIINGGNAFGIN